MIFGDENRAKSYLINISYYRLSAYCFPYKNMDSTSEYFIKPISFEHILNIYLFDKEFKLLLFDAIERIKIALRSKMTNSISKEFGEYFYKTPSLYSKKDIYNKIDKQIAEQLKRSKEVFIKHYKNKYNEPKHPPSWIISEIVSLGTLSNVYRNLKMCDSKKDVSKQFGLNHPKTLESWLQSITYVRNIIAHHSRLWNRTLTIIPVFPKNKLVNDFIINPSSNKSQLYYILCTITYLLNELNPTSSMKMRLKNLIKKYPDLDLTEMGFPDTWINEPLWE